VTWTRRGRGRGQGPLFLSEKHFVSVPLPEPSLPASIFLIRQIGQQFADINGTIPLLPLFGVVGVQIDPRLYERQHVTSQGTVLGWLPKGL
jgi:hypothetical protein